MSPTQPTPADSSQPNANDLRPGLRPPQFRLSTILWWVAGLCVIFALMPRIGPYGSFVLILGTAAVALHVIGNALGTQLRENGDTLLDEAGRPLPRRRRIPPEQRHFAPTTTLGAKGSLGFTLLVLTSAGAIVGAIGGGAALALLMGPGASIPSLAVAILSSGVLGGFLGFLTSSFTQVLFGAIRHASRESSRKF